MNDNPYAAVAERVLEQHRPWLSTTARERNDAIQSLLIALGATDLTTPNTPIPVDAGVAALMAVCQFLKMHGGTIAAMTAANEQLHQPADGSLPPKRAW